MPLRFAGLGGLQEDRNCAAQRMLERRLERVDQIFAEREARPDQDDQRRREQCDTIGNFVLLTTKVNQKADRLDYRAKKEIYFNGGGGQEFALTRDLME